MLWQKIRSGVMFIIAFVSCPCHLPLTLPLALALLAGTSAAVWITQHTNLIYGSAIILFLVCLAFGFLWTRHESSIPSDSCVVQNQAGKKGSVL